MDIVIDDFEVADAEDSGQVPGSAPIANNCESSLTARDIERVVERQCERYERVWAH